MDFNAFLFFLQLPCILSLLSIKMKTCVKFCNVEVALLLLLFTILRVKNIFHFFQIFIFVFFTSSSDKFLTIANSLSKTNKVSISSKDLKKIDHILID